MKSITVKELLKACQEQVAKGNGDKEIYLSNDDEGNGVHKLFYLFSENIKDSIETYNEIPADKLKDSILLG